VGHGECAASHQPVGVVPARREPDAVQQGDLDVVAVVVELTEDTAACAAPRLVPLTVWQQLRQTIRQRESGPVGWVEDQAAIHSQPLATREPVATGGVD